MNTQNICFIVDNVKQLELPEEILGFSIDAPTQANHNYGTSIAIAGWVSGTDPYTVPSIEIMNGETLLKRISVNISRPDVAAYLNKIETDSVKFGFHTAIGTLGLRNETKIEIILNIYDPRNKSRIKKKIATLQGRKRNNLLTDCKYQPLMLTAIGRSGTTLAMQIFSEHKRILTSDFYPYEVKQAAYWMHLLKVLSDPADFENSSHPDAFERDFFKIGHNPYTHPESMRQFPAPAKLLNYYNSTLPFELAKFTTQRISDFYDIIAEFYNKNNATLFAEKFLPTHLQSMFNDIFSNPKEIILTRDFRDMICSAQSFNDKRKTQGFGREKASDEFDWINRIFSTGARRLAEAWKDRQSTALHIRYEDLILDPPTQLRIIFNHLEIESTDSIVNTITNKIFNSEGSSHHKTSLSPEKSISRWKTEMSPELIEYSNDKLKNELSLFGYQ